MRFRETTANWNHIRESRPEALGGDPERIRTSDLQIRNLPLYPAELRGLIVLCAEAC